MPTGIEVSGLSNLKDNFNKLSALAQTEIGRKALRDAGWTLAKAMRAATYTTFHRQSGAIQRGLGVAVSATPKENKLVAAVNEYPQDITGTSPAAVLFRKHLRLKGHRPSKKQGGGGLRVDLQAFAYWWRFLERGTGPRHAMKTPRGRRTSARQIARAQRWQASPSRGGIKSREWLRPVFNSRAPDAIASLRDTFLKLVDAAVSNMPKQ